MRFYARFACGNPHPLSENAARMYLLRAGRRQLESSLYGPDCLHFESFKVNLDLVYAMPETLTKSRFECTTPATDPTRDVSAHASIRHAAIPHSPQSKITRFHTSPIQHNSFPHLTVSLQCRSCATVLLFYTRVYLR